MRRLDTYCDMHAPSLSCSRKKKYLLGHKNLKRLENNTFETLVEHAKKGNIRKNIVIPQYQILRFDAHL